MWTSNSKVKYISPFGRESIKTIRVTTEGFASILDNDTEVLFDTRGYPINMPFNTDTNGPSIQLITQNAVNTQNTSKKTKNINKNRTITKTFITIKHYQTI
ncbi:MAG: hypothetical protein HC836_22670 [Richelia sp. RM2_1_2]|nr:hypothetical protein [Richelia sp. RM2_1_2]